MWVFLSQLWKVKKALKMTVIWRGLWPTFQVGDAPPCPLGDLSLRPVAAHLWDRPAAACVPWLHPTTYSPEGG